MSDLLPAEHLLKRRPRKATMNPKRASKKELHRQSDITDHILEDMDVTRPKTRGDCLEGVNAQRPCPWVSCKYHLAIGVSLKNGSLTQSFGDTDVENLHDTCTLDVADRGGLPLSEVGTAINLTRERVRQIEQSGLAKVRAEFQRLGIEAGDFERVFSDHASGSLEMQDHRDHQKHIVRAIRNGRVHAAQRLTPGDMQIYSTKGYRYAVKRVKEKLNKYLVRLAMRKARLEICKTDTTLSLKRIALAERNVRIAEGHVEALRLRLVALQAE